LHGENSEPHNAEFGSRAESKLGRQFKYVMCVVPNKRTVDYYNEMLGASWVMSQYWPRIPDEYGVRKLKTQQLQDLDVSQSAIREVDVLLVA
jgi:hypothetical protein